MKNRPTFVLGIAAGIVAGTVMSGLVLGPKASAQLPPLSPPSASRQPAGGGGAQSVLLDERRQELVYANGFRLFTSSEEVVADLGFNMPNPSSQNNANVPGLLFDVRMRLVMSFATAKRFQDGLSEALKQVDERTKATSQPAR